MIQARRFFAHKQNWVGLTLVGLFFFLAIAAPWLSPPLDPEAPSEYKELKSTFYQLPNSPRPGSPWAPYPNRPSSAPASPWVKAILTNGMSTIPSSGVLVPPYALA